MKDIKPWIPKVGDTAYYIDCDKIEKVEVHGLFVDSNNVTAASVSSPKSRFTINAKGTGYKKSSYWWIPVQFFFRTVKEAKAAKLEIKRIKLTQTITDLEHTITYHHSRIAKSNILLKQLKSELRKISNL